MRFKYLRKPNRRKFEGAKNEQIVDLRRIYLTASTHLLAPAARFLGYLMRTGRIFWALPMPVAPVAKPIDISKKGNKADFLTRIEKPSYP